jgi:regulator of sigma E protease
MTILHYLLIALEVVLLFNLIIGVHELGHFLAARWRGLKVERFAIWFGKPIWKKKINGVEYALGTIPFGGYVSLPQMATMEAIEGKTDEKAEQLPNVSPLDKIIVAFAGPLFSFLLAVVFAAIVWKVGKPTNEADNTTIVGWADVGGPAWKAGLRPGDAILEVDNKPVHHFSPTSADSVTWRIVTSAGTNIPIKYIRDQKENTVFAPLFHRETKWYERKALRQVLLRPAMRSIIYQVVTNSPAALAGLTNGDEIIALNGEKIFHPAAIFSLQDLWSNSPPQPVVLTVKRGTEQFDRTLLAVKPVQPTNSHPLLGLVELGDETKPPLVYPTPMEQIKASAGQIFNTFSALFARHGDIGVQQLGGAVMILRVYSNLFQDEDGWRRVLWFSVILNVNLALLNLLPLPMLDGGHILLSLIEAIRRRRSSAAILNHVQNGFAALLISFMIYIAFFDIGDWIRSARADRDVPVVFAPPAK